MTVIRAWLDQGREIADQATEGPWYPWDRGVGWLIALSDSDDGQPRLPEGMRTDLGRGEDAAFIADARTRLPQALAAIQAVLNLHQPVEVEPSETICAACSNRLPSGRFMPIVEWPCPPVEAIQAAIGDTE